MANYMFRFFSICRITVVKLVSAEDCSCYSETVWSWWCCPSCFIFL